MLSDIRCHPAHDHSGNDEKVIHGIAEVFSPMMSYAMTRHKKNGVVSCLECCISMYF